jgi:hypothetical protein
LDRRNAPDVFVSHLDAAAETRFNAVNAHCQGLVIVVGTEALVLLIALNVAERCDPVGGGLGSASS